MDWLNAFDPAAPRSSNQQQLSHGAGSSSAAGSSAPRPRPIPSTLSSTSSTGPPQTGRTTRLYDYSAYTGPSSATIRPRPPIRPPQRTRIAPPSSALRSEDAQPNENEVRAKPWEVSAPPTIGMARSKKPTRPPTNTSNRPLPSQARPSAPYAQQRPPFPLPQRPRPHPDSVWRPTPAPPVDAPTAPLTKKQRRKIREQQKQQLLQAKRNEAQPPTGPSLKKARLDDGPSSLSSSTATASQTSKLNSRSISSLPVTFDEVFPEIRLWARTARDEADRMIANANLGTEPLEAIKWLRGQLATTKKSQTQHARSHAGTNLENHRNYSDELCLALRNHPQLLLTLLKVRAELYRYIPSLMPASSKVPMVDERRYAVNLVRYGRNAWLQLLGLRVADIDASSFCATEQMLRPADAIELKGVYQLNDKSEPGHHALTVIENYIKTFGVRIFDQTLSDVDEWKRQNRPQETSEDDFEIIAVPQKTNEDDSESLSIDAPWRKSPAPTRTPLFTSQLNDTSALQPLAAEGAKETASEPAVMEHVHTPPPPPRPELQQDTPEPTPTPATPSPERKLPTPRKTSARPSSHSPRLAQLNGVVSIVERDANAAQVARRSTPEHSMLLRSATERERSQEAILAEAREAEELARYLEQLSDDESVASVAAVANALPAPLAQVLNEKLNASEHKPTLVKAEKIEEVDEVDELMDEEPTAVSEPSAAVQTLNDHNSNIEADGEDDDDIPLASILATQSRLPSSVDSDPEEDVPLQDLLQRQSSAAPSVRTAQGRSEESSSWPSEPFEPKISGLKHPGAFSTAHGLSIKYFVPVASSALDARTPVRSRATVFDAAIAVNDHGRMATFAEERAAQPRQVDHDLPRKIMQVQAHDRTGKVKSEKASPPIDRVEDVSRLTSKVCGIASSTKKLLGLGNHNDYPSQVSLVTVDDTGRAHRAYHLDERPHAQGAASMSHFPRTDPDNASSIDFATGGIDGIVNHWRWKAKSTKAETFRLHTLHDAKPVVALEHLSSRSNILASASIGTVIGYDLAALTLGFSWNTSDHIVHLQRTPDPKLMLGVLARRDYDQFRMFDITGRNGPISRPVISFGWLNDADGKLPLGRGTFHPTRRAIFAHGAEDGHVRVWDMRNARDPLIDQRIGDEPIVQAIWASSKGSDDDDIMYVATTKGVRSISLLAP